MLHGQMSQWKFSPDLYFEMSQKKLSNKVFVKHNLDLNRNYNLMGFDTIEINLVQISNIL